MRNGIFTIMRKELSRFFGDKRLVVSILLPGILVYVMYSFMGSAMGSNFGVDEDYVPTVQAVDLPASMEALLSQTGFAVVVAADEAAAKESVTAQELDLLMVFPKDFDETVAAYQAASGSPAPNVELYYNSASTNSTFTYQTVVALLDTYEAGMVNKFDVTPGAKAMTWPPMRTPWAVFSPCSCPCSL